jgi:hypothetical protein
LIQIKEIEILAASYSLRLWVDSARRGWGSTWRIEVAALEEVHAADHPAIGLFHRDTVGLGGDRDGQRATRWRRMRSYGSGCCRGTANADMRNIRIDVVGTTVETRVPIAREDSFVRLRDPQALAEDAQVVPNGMARSMT